MSHLGEVPIRRRVWLASTGGDPRTAILAGTQSHTRARLFYIGPHVHHCTIVAFQDGYHSEADAVVVQRSAIMGATDHDITTHG
jgi:hypothetical protein